MLNSYPCDVLSVWGSPQTSILGRINWRLIHCISASLDFNRNKGDRIARVAEDRNQLLKN